jgi:acetyl/propionyl-CoA carboxylase alpha subunit
VLLCKGAAAVAAAAAAVQVEHGITEMVNGFVDIVEWMLRLQLPDFLAPLHLDSLETDRSGWAIEVGLGPNPPAGAACLPHCRQTA